MVKLMSTALEAPVSQRDWVRLHIVVLAVIVGVALGILIIDTQVGNFVDARKMPLLRSIFFLSVLTAGIGARALLARNTATVDKQGWVFLVVTGLLLLAAAAYGFADCYVEVRDAYYLALRITEKSL